MPATGYVGIANFPENAQQRRGWYMLFKLCGIPWHPIQFHTELQYVWGSRPIEQCIACIGRNMIVPLFLPYHWIPQIAYGLGQIWIMCIGYYYLEEVKSWLHGNIFSQRSKVNFWPVL